MSKLSRVLFLPLAFLVACSDSRSTLPVSHPHPQQPVGAITPGPDMSTARAGDSVSVMGDFKILISGGKDAKGKILDTTEVYDPTHGTFAAGPNMLEPRSGHFSTLLGDNKVLVVGGMTSGGTALSSSEVYDYETYKFAARGSMHSRRYRPAGLMLRDGRVLVAGGEDHGRALDSAEVYSVLDGRWKLVGRMTAPRAGHTATLLPDGRVLIVGGWGSHHVALDSAEIFDPRTNKFTAAALLPEPRCLHSAGLLANGQVLIAGGATSGGTDHPGGAPMLHSALVYDPKTNTFTETGATSDTHVDATSIFTMPDGRAVLIGGSSSGEIYELHKGEFRTVEGSLDVPRFGSTALQVMDGSLRIFGGADAEGVSTAMTWTYHLASVPSRP